MTTGERSGTLLSEGFPHPYRERGLEFDVESIEFKTDDDGSITDDAVQIVDSDRRVSLVQASGWNTAVVSGSVTVPETVFNATLPFDEREEPPVALILAARCSQTILRIGKVGTTSDLEIDSPDTYDVEATLHLEDVRGDVMLKPYLIRDRPQDVEEGYASATADRLASDDAWVVRVDQSEDDGGFLHPLIEPFDNYPTFPDGEHLHHLHFENPSTPKLYLNANHGQLIDVLFNEGTRGADPRFRDVLYDYIEHSVWQELLLRTANDADPETGETRHPWQEETVNEFREQLYDDADTVSEVAARMGTDAQSGEDLDRLVGEIESAVQHRIDHPDTALKLFQEGLHNDRD